MEHLTGRLAIRTLGGLHLDRQGVPIDELSTRKAAALLVYVACAAQPQPREVMAEFFWEGRTQSRALGNLRVALTNLRQTVGEFITITREAISLNDGYTTWVDAATFESLALSKQITDLETAIALYGGDFLAGFYVDSQGFENWALLERERLRYLMIGALDRLVATCLACDDCIQGISYATRLLEIDPLREQTYRQLMQLLARAGQRTAALQQYKHCLHMLEEELGVPPATETTMLAEQIQAGTFSPAMITPSPSRTPLPTTGERGNLPRQATSFIGREEEIAHIHAQLAQPDCRLLTLVGPGGIGKSRLALAAAELLLGTYPHGVYFVELAPLVAPEHLVQAIAAELGFEFYHRQGNPRQQLLAYLKEQHLLLVLDNFEHLLAGVDLVSDILSTAPQVQVIATSREALRLDWEWLLEVHGMPYQADDKTLDPSPAREQDFSAVRLFVERARRQCPGFSLHDHRANVIHICRLLGGVPLAIELAAAWMRALSCEALIDELTRSLDILETQQRNVPDRHRSMRAVFKASWARLNADEQRAFMRLSVFRGGFTQEAAQQIAGASLRTLLALINKSLLWRDAISGRYTIHELLHQYAEEQLLTAGEAESIQHTHCRYYTDLLATLAVDIRGRRQQEALNEIEADFENVRAAWQRAAQHVNYSAISRMLEALMWFSIFRSHFRDGEALLQQARKTLAPQPGEPPDPTWVQLMGSYILYGVTDVHAQMHRSLALAQECGDQRLIANAQWGLAVAARDAGNIAKALNWAEQCLPYYRAIDDKFIVTSILYLMGLCYDLSGQFEKAIQLNQESLALARQTGNVYSTFRILVSLCGQLLLGIGDDTKAEDYLRQAEQVGYDLGDRTTFARHKIHQSLFSFFRGDFERATTFAEEATKLAPSIAYYDFIRASALAICGMVASVAEDYTRGKALCQESLSVPFSPGMQALAEVGLAMALCGEGDYQAARQQVITTLRNALPTLSIAAMAWCLPVAASILAHDRQHRRAAEVLSLAFAHPANTTDWMEKWPLLMRLRAQLEAELGPAACAAAWERGKTLNLETVVQEILAELG